MSSSTLEAPTTVTLLTTAACVVNVGPHTPGPRLSHGLISVQAVDQDSSPFPGIPVLLKAEPRYGRNLILTTDADGRARFAGLVPGRQYDIGIEPPVGISIEAPERADDGSVGSHRYRLLDLRAGVQLSVRDRTLAEEDIAETVFRSLVAYELRGLQARGQSYYPAQPGKDPRPEFLSRFRTEQAGVGHGSQFEPGEGSAPLSIYYVAWLTEDSVEVAAGYSSGLLGCACRTYVLIRKDAGWSVQSDARNWIS